MRSVRIAALAALTLIGAAGAVVVSIGAAVTAQAATDGVVDLGPVASAAIEVVAPVLITLLGGLASLALARISKSTGLKIDADHRAAIDQALRKAATYAVGRLDDRAKGGIPIAVKSEAIEIAADYALSSVPDALKHFGIGTDRLKSMVEARLTDWVFDPDEPDNFAARIRPFVT
ncbi:hypothetical protein [Amorphus coralli]|uniref:hypothetical protein n=1 Tax=Amorphus coralli TaxID=340680 RepID=UPI0003805910|nr:hypothetical protein [Amorphus coralli]